MNQTPLSHGAAQKQLMKTFKTEWGRFQSQNPQFAALTLKVEAHIYKKRPQGYSKVYVAIMDRLLWRGYADKTQKMILEEIRPQHPTQNIVANIWNKRLTKKQLATMKTRIQGSDRRTMNLNITGCRTLAQIKKRIQALNHSAEASQIFKGTIAIDAKAVVVGKKTYPIEAKGTGEYKYPSIRVTVGKKRPFVRVDALAALLEK